MMCPIRSVVLGAASAVLFLAVPLRGAEEDPFAANVRPTEPRTPEEQQKTLRVPAGFEVQLVTCEPDIHKPMNLAFDALGRLWVTTSREYPFPRPVGEAGRDRVQVFEDFGPDGRARKVTTFADGLNIPTGVYPFRSAASSGARGADGEPVMTWKAVVWSIPNLWLLEDTDGDGKADRKDVLFGPFDHTRDTHGNQSSFRRGFDGWLYATHGFNNDSHVTSRDGNKVDLNSGNTYRMRLDGTRLEHYTWGQVNPFGLAWDPEGNLWSSDCHSEPIYLLQKGGYYPSFGKPHDGLGFAPNVMDAVRGSTAIDGISYYADDLWPAEYRDCVYVGDVMTSRVYRDRVEVRGSGRITRAQADFVVSEDPWFRPVDTTVGPDGALYVADFYNRIIGHYEVPLNHPGRDRERGRIWRVIHRGTDGKASLRSARVAADRDGLVAELASPSLARRMLAMNDLADRFGAGAKDALQKVVAKPANAFQHVHALWLLRRLGGLGSGELSQAGSAPDPFLRVHVQRIAGDLLAQSARGEAVPEGELSAAMVLATVGLKDAEPGVQRGAAEALANLPSGNSLRPLLALRAKVGPNDPHLLYAVRQAIRNQLNNADVARGQLGRDDWSEAERRWLVDVAVAVPSEPAASFLLRNRTLYVGDGAFTAVALAHAARYAATAELESLVAELRAKPGWAVDEQLALYRSMQQGLNQRGSGLTPAIRAWGVDLAGRLLESVAASATWVSRPLEGAGAGLGPSGNPWEFEERACADGTRARLLSSFPRGEALTGVLRSRAFAAPPRISFYLCGHDGRPEQAAQRRNVVRLREAGGTAVLFEAPTPRNDTARKVEWDLGPNAGKSVVLEVVDGDAGDAYAWLAFGRIEPAVLALPDVAPAEVVGRQVAAAEIASAAGAEAMTPAFERLAREASADPAARAAAARASSANPLVRAAAEMVGDASLPYGWRSRAADVLFDPERTGAEELIADVWKNAPVRFQIRFAGLSATSPRLGEEMVRRMEDGRAPVGLLQDRRLRERLAAAVADGSERETLERLVKALPEEDPAVQRLLEERRAGLKSADVNPGRGRDVFAAACAVCHQINGQGGLVGPQLTGIGTRGAERLCEDILVPNRNVDRAFWTTVLTLKDGETTSGLFRREEGELIVLANAAGAEFTVKKSEVTGRKESNLSLMPSNFGDALPVSDFYSLVAYLLTQTGKP